MTFDDNFKYTFTMNNKYYKLQHRYFTGYENEDHAGCFLIKEMCESHFKIAGE